MIRKEYGWFILPFVIALCILLWGYTFTSSETYEIVEPVKTLDSEIDRLSLKYFISSSTVRAIARCESSMYGSAINHNTNGTVDKGYLQINSVHYENMAQLGLSSDDEWDLLEFGFLLMSKQGLQPWSASRHCWKDKI